MAKALCKFPGQNIGFSFCVFFFYNRKEKRPEENGSTVEEKNLYAKHHLLRM